MSSEDKMFLTFFAILGCIMVVFLYFAISTSIENQKNHNEFKIKCIEAGGNPVSPFEYVKGHGEGYLCINPSAIIEVE